MQATKIYKTPKRNPPTVIDLSKCAHTFGPTWQKTAWSKNASNLPTTSVHKYQTCTGCGYEKPVG